MLHERRTSAGARPLFYQPPQPPPQPPPQGQSYPQPPPYEMSPPRRKRPRVGTCLATGVLVALLAIGGVVGSALAMDYSLVDAWLVVDGQTEEAEDFQFTYPGDWVVLDVGPSDDNFVSVVSSSEVRERLTGENPVLRLEADEYGLDVDYLDYLDDLPVRAFILGEQEYYEAQGDAEFEALNSEDILGVEGSAVRVRGSFITQSGEEVGVVILAFEFEDGLLNIYGYGSPAQADRVEDYVLAVARTVEVR